MRGLSGRLLGCESGQTQLEYILMLATAIGFVLMLIRIVIRPGLTALGDAISARVENTLFRKENLHRFPIRR
jgi:hypothetical protein